ncbi:SDR family oxidoreductase [Rhizobium binxianense]
MKKTWLITGTSSGFGRILTEKLLARGDRVAATLRKTDALAGLGRQYGDRLRLFTMDLTDAEAIKRTVDEAFGAFGHIDLAVSNAGYGLFGTAEEASVEQIRHQLDINLLGSILFIRACIPHLRAQGGGRIIQVSSEGGQIAYPNFSLYHATKWGIEGFIEAAAQEVSSFGIDFVIAEPGPTATNFGAGLVHADPMVDYDKTPAGDIRRAISNGSFVIKGDAERSVDAMIAAADAKDPPFRLALGSSAYEGIGSALRERLRALEAQRDTALSADRH